MTLIVIIFTWIALRNTDIFYRYRIGSSIFTLLAALIEMAGNMPLTSRRNFTARNSLPIVSEEDGGLEDVN